MNLLPLEKNYINLVSTQLENFSWKKDNLANCRCVICGDSAMSKKKSRGYFYLSKNRRFRYKCQNCGINWSVANFIERISPTVYNEYRLDYLKELGKSPSSSARESMSSVLDEFKYSPPESVPCSEITHTSEYESVKELHDLSPVYTLPVFHSAYQYLTVERKFDSDAIRNLYFTSNFRDYLYNLNSKHNYNIDCTRYPDDARIVIPFIERGTNRLVGLQARAIGITTGTIRYITVKLDDFATRIYGLNRVDFKKKIYCCEGPLDSLYLPNCVAISGSSLYTLESLLSPAEHRIDVTYIPDNQPRNKEIVREVAKLVDNNLSVVIWEPRSERQYGKDIGDMIEHGLTPAEVLWEIQRRTFKGIPAKLAFDTWYKI